MSKANELERREFLRLGAGGLAAGVLSAGCATMASSQEKKTLSAEAAQQPTQAPAATPAQPAGPPRRRLGRTGIEVPIVSMGVMNADNPNLVRAALDGGIFLLDTAHGYQEGRNEEMLGTVLKDSFMYAHAYRNREAAQALLLELALPEFPCGDCGECPVRCAQGFDIRQRVRDIARLREVPREFLI
jgi:hypothetical protein